MIVKRPLRCWLGCHRWYLDGAMIRHVHRCCDCGKADDPGRAAALDRERERLAAVPPGAPYHKLVLAALGEPYE